ncbi:uncharacterized protein LOC101889956 isoform X4 [Musca domestica]|uniref:Uncharacterized protein LOC101889956 isoform X4 n=1 Tax=Musca domestica TaxID=7370 RepID=A0ABM3VPN7_MUSDO|nr:uncharacterized protein LOC101889956 isoform X4 [Musca domestica]
MAAVQRKLVHKQFNSPIGLYSQQNVKETLDRELKAFGSDGIEIDDQIAKPLNLANSAVLRAVEEEEQEMKCETFTTGLATAKNDKPNQRQSRSRQRYQERPHTPLHHQQLEQIKTQYLSHQHDITIDRDTVLKINRLATRRNLHKREHSWPPTSHHDKVDAIECDGDGGGDNDDDDDDDDEQIHSGNAMDKRHLRQLQQQQHVRSSSTDNALQFDESVCKRHGIDVIREKFNSPTRIIEPTAREVRLRRQRAQEQPQTTGHQSSRTKCREQRTKVPEKQDVIKEQKYHHLQQPQKTTLENKSNEEIITKIEGCNGELEQSDDKHKQQQLGLNESKNMFLEKPQQEGNNDDDDEVYRTTSLPATKGFSHPETKAADEDIGLVEPRRQFYEQLTSCKKWFSYENLNSACPSLRPKKKDQQLHPRHHYHHPKRQSYSLERGRDVKHTRRQLPPQKPRSSNENSPKLQRRSIKMATEIKICYDADAEEHEIQVKSLNHPKSKTMADDLENVPLPVPPTAKSAMKSHQNHQIPINLDYEMPREGEDLLSTPSLRDNQKYDDACIYLRSIDLQDNTVAYIPAAITIVPSPSEEQIQQWLAEGGGQLKANIKEEKQENENLMEKFKLESMKIKPPSSAEGDEEMPTPTAEHNKTAKQQANAKHATGHTHEEPETYITRLPSTPNGIQLSRQTSVSAKRKSQSSNVSNSSTASTAGIKTKAKQDATTTPRAKEDAPLESGGKQDKGIYYTDGEYLYGPYDPTNGKPLSSITIKPIEHDPNAQMTPSISNEIKKDTQAETIEKNQQQNEIADLTAKYEHIQKSITEHLRQIDAYIENAKTALKRSMQAEKTQSKDQQSAEKAESDTKSGGGNQAETLNTPETPLQTILKKIAYIMEEVKPTPHAASQPQGQTAESLSATFGQIEESMPQPGLENMAIVDRVLSDLNKLTDHLKEQEPPLDIVDHRSLQPLIDNLKQMPSLDVKFETWPKAQKVSYVHIEEEKEKEGGEGHKMPATSNKLDEPQQKVAVGSQENDEKCKPITAVGQKETSKCQTPAPAITLKQTIQEQEHEHERSASGNSKLITSMEKPTSKSHSMAAGTTTVPGNNLSKDLGKNLVSEFITTYHQQEQLLDQVIDTLGKCNQQQQQQQQQHSQIKKDVGQLKPKQTNHQVATNNDAGHGARQRQHKAGDEMANTKGKKSNLNQPASSQLPANREKNAAVTHSVRKVARNLDTGADETAENMAPAPGSGTPLHGGQRNDRPRLKLAIKNATGIMADKQFPKYDKQLTNSGRPSHKPGKEPSIADKSVKLEDEQCRQQVPKTTPTNGDTYKSSYELPSPYVTERQISWEDVQANISSTPKCHGHESKSVDVTASKEKEPTAKEQTLSMASGHVEMQSTMPSKSRMQATQKSPPRQESSVLTPPPPPPPPPPFCTKLVPTDDKLRKYPAPLIEPHLAARRSASPFGLNAVDTKVASQPRTPSPPLRLVEGKNKKSLNDGSNATNSKQRTPSVSPGRGGQQGRSQNFTGPLRKYPAPLAEPYPPRGSVSPIDSIYTRQRSKSMSPARVAPQSTTCLRKYPAPLAEPYPPRRSMSPFDPSFSKQRSKSVSPGRVSNVSETLRKYPAPLAEPYPPRRSMSPSFSKQRSKSVSPGRAGHVSVTLRKYPAPLAEPYPPRRSVSPFHCKHRSTSKSPAREANSTNLLRKYPAPLVEPYPPRRSCSPFDVQPRSESKSPVRAGQSLKSHIETPPLPFIEAKSQPHDTSSATQRSKSKSPAKNPNEDSIHAIRKYPAPLAEPYPPQRAKSPFEEYCTTKRSNSPSWAKPDGLENKLQKYSIPQTSTIKAIPTPPPPPPPPPSMSLEKNTRNISPIRKYPSALIEPHVPSRSASPFGLNVVDDNFGEFQEPNQRAHTPLGLNAVLPPPPAFDDLSTTSTMRKYPSALIEAHVATSRASSPAGLNAGHTNWSEKMASIQSPSPVGRHNKTTTAPQEHNAPAIVSYVPQVEGQNVGLLVHAVAIPPQATATAVMVTDSTVKRYSPENESSNIPISTARSKNARTSFSNADRKFETDDKDDQSQELQCINTFDTTGHGVVLEINKNNNNRVPSLTDADDKNEPSQRRAATTTSTTTGMLKSNLPSATMSSSNEQEYQHFDQQHCHMTAEMVNSPASVINRSFDNVSPRPYISIEGYKRVAWPPANEERVVREFTPQPHAQYTAPLYAPQAQEQNQPQQHQQQYQPNAAVPSTQGPIYNNVHYHAPTPQQQQQPHPQHPYYSNQTQQQQPTSYINATTTSTNNNHARETMPPNSHNQGENDEPLYEPFPPQTPEAPIVLIDKQFSRLPSQEPMQMNYGPAASAAQHHKQPEWQQQQQQQPREEPPKQMPSSFNQQPTQYYQQQYLASNRNQQQQPPTHQQQQHSQYPHTQHQHPAQYQPAEPHHEQATSTGGHDWYYMDRPQHNPNQQEFANAKPTGLGQDEALSPAQPIYQKQYESYHQQRQQQHEFYQEKYKDELKQRMIANQKQQELQQQHHQHQYKPSNPQTQNYPQQQHHPTQYQPFERDASTPSRMRYLERSQTPKPEYGKTVRLVGHDGSTTHPIAKPIYQKQYDSYHQQRQRQHEFYQQQYRQELQQQYQQQQQPKQYSPQPQYQGQGPVGNQYNQYQQPQQPYQQPTTWVQEQHLPQPYKPPTQQAQYQQPQQQQQQQPQYQASSYQPTPQYQASSYQPQQAPLNNQYQTPYQNQYVSQPNQQQFNSYSQPQQQQHQQQQPPQQNVQNVSHGSDQLDNLKQHDQRGASPGIITLRKEAPISQAPAPVYTSQPAAVSFQGGSKLRGDLKWPPPEYKEAAARENEERRQLALGPVCRPRKVNRDYSSFFAKNALSHHYPSYKVPPGTQHVTY